MRYRITVLPKVRRALRACLAVLPLVTVLSCGSPEPHEEAGDGPTLAEEPGPEPAPAPEVEKTDPQPPEPPTAGPPPPPATPVDELLTPEKTVQENVAVVRDLSRAVREKLGVFDLPEGDERRSDETWVRFEAGRERLAELYREGSFEADDHRTLCTVLTGLGKEFHEIAVQHCKAYMEMTEPLDDPASYSMIMSTAAEVHRRAGEYPQAEKLYLKFLETFCEAELDRQVQTRILPNCRRILTQQLPSIYHETRNVRALEDTLARCWAMKIERDNDLTSIRGYLVEDLWLSDDLAALDKLSGELLSMNVWGEKASKTNIQLMAPAISARARVRLLQKNCFSARQVYYDYEFDHPQIDETWRHDNVLVPSRLLCRPAPAIEVSDWSGGRAPAPAEGKLTLIHFVDAKTRNSLTGLSRLKEIAASHPGRLQTIALVLVGDKIFPPGASPKHGLEPATFKKEFDTLSAEQELGFPVGYLSSGEDPTVTGFRVQRYPTTVLIGADGNVAAYHPLPSLDAGWDTLIKELGN